MSVKAEQKGLAYDDARLTLLGNSWQVGVVARLVLQLMAPLGLCLKTTLQALVDEFTAGKGNTLYQVRMRPPFPSRQNAPPNQDTIAVVRRLLILGMTTSKGEDLWSSELF